MATPLNPYWQRLLRGSGMVLTLKVLGALSGYAFVYLMVKTMGKEGYGHFELVFTFLSLAGVVARWGYDGLVVRELPAHKGQWQEQKRILAGSFLLVTGFALLLSILLVLSRGLLSNLFHAPALEDSLLYVAVLLLPWSWFQLQSDVWRAQNNMLAYGLWQYGSLTFVASILLLLFQAHSPILYISLALLPFIPWIIKSWIPLFGISWKEAWSHARVHFPTATVFFVSSLLYTVLMWSDTLLIGYFLDESSVGVYRVAYKVSTLIIFAQFAVNAQLAPDISRYWAKRKMDSLQNAVKRIAWINTVISVPAFVVLFAGAPFFLGFFGSDFALYADLLRVLAIGQLSNALCGPVLYLLNMTGNEKAARNTLILGVIVNILGNVLLIPWLGLLGSAMATSFTIVLWNVWALREVYKKTGIRTFLFWR